MFYIWIWLMLLPFLALGKRIGISCHTPIPERNQGSDSVFSSAQYKIYKFKTLILEQLKNKHF